MNKTTKIIIAFSVALVIAASVLVVTLINYNNEGKPESTGPAYTLRPTTTVAIPANTDSWIDINQIAGELTSTTGETGTDTSSTTMGPIQVPNGVTQFIYVDQYGNVVDPNNIKPGTTKPTTTQMDTTEALDTPVTDDDNQMDEFEINNEGVITGYYGDSNTVMIPVKAQGKAVKGIGPECFKDSKVESVYIPDTVTSIGKSAFENCASLTSIVFASNKTKVTIGQNAFKNCLALKEISLPACDVGMTAFDNCTALRKVIFAKGTETIGAYCFSNCRSLESVYIPSSAVSFGNNVFDGCSQEKMRVFTPLGSDAEVYAQNNGFKTAEY